MKKSSFTPKVLELISREVAGYFTGTEIVKILEKIDIPRDQIQYPNTKWWTVNEAFKYLQNNDREPEIAICRLIMEFLHPLNHNLNEESAEKLSKKVEKFLKYDNFFIQYTGTEYIVMSGEEMDEMHEPPVEVVQQYEKEKKEEEITIKDESENIKSILDNHQALMDLLELFCSNLKKPTKELNDAYLFLIKKIEKSLNELGLRAHKITLYKPFTGDLYTAEAEWNGINDYDLRLGPKLSWDAIRPSLYRVHSEITKLYNLAKEDADKSDDDKRLEQIKNFIADKRVQKKPSENEKVQKMEILHKYEDKPQKQKIKLSDHRLSFDGETAELQIGDFQPVSFPPYKNEHYALRKLFSQKKNEPVDWQEVYEAMTSTKSDTINKIEIEKQKKTVKDTVRAINQRIKEVGGVDTDLLKWDIKCVKRLY